MRNTRALLVLAGLLLVSVAPAQAQVKLATAIDFPAVGVGFDQTLQINVVGFNPCVGQIVISDGDGRPVESISINFTKVGFSYAKQTANSGASGFPQRRQLRATVDVNRNTTSPCMLQATAEVYDNFTKSDWVLTPGLAPPGPNNTPIYFGPVGATFAQTVRLNVAAVPTDPCFGVISFIDVNGNSLGSELPVNLTGGMATYLDLPGIEAVAPPGVEDPVGVFTPTSAAVATLRRADVVGVFTPTVGEVPGVCSASLEVYDQLTGYTRVLVPQPTPNVSQSPPS